MHLKAAIPIFLLTCSLVGAGPLTRMSNETLALPDTLPTGSFTTEDAFPSLRFSYPVAIAQAPNDDTRLFVVEQTGLLIVLPDLENPSKETFLDLTDRTQRDGESGLLGVAFHPNHASNGYLYVCYSTSTSPQYLRVSRFSLLAGNPNRADSASEVIMIEQQDQATNHNGGDLHFGPDGYLYISTGDEGDANDSYNNGRFIDKDFFSAILRIDVDQRPENLSPNSHASVKSGTYKVPADNPFIGVTEFWGNTVDPDDVRTEIWAAGLRNPWRMAFDQPTGRLFCGDVGQSSREEVNLIEKGKHYGWSHREGSQGFSSGPGGNTPPNGFTAAEPIWDYPTSEGTTIIGGMVYRGTELTELYEHYVFADYGSSRIWAMNLSNSPVTVTQIATFARISAFGTDPRNGDVLMTEVRSSGGLRRLVRAAPPTGPSPPMLLSQTGAFSQLSTLTPNPGIVAYTPNVPFWSDGAVKQRWFSIPDTNDAINFSETGPWAFPEGAVWIKHFDLDLTPENLADSPYRVETRFLKKTSDGIYGVTYRWNAAQDDAELVDESGLEEDFTITQSSGNTTQSWRFPSRSECLTCHTSGSGHVLGFNTAQLNRNYDYGGIPYHQLQALSEASYFETPLTQVHTLPTLAPIDDTTQSLEHRVRSYLAVNCAQCHHPGGNALGAWDARSHITTASAAIVDGPLIHSPTDPIKILTPGNESLSMLLHRLEGTSGKRMPPLGSSVIDQQAVTLIKAWIAELDGTWQTFEDWQAAQFGAPLPLNSGPSEDFDGDRETNYFEFLTLTDPKAANDRWSPDSATIGNQLRVQFNQIPNRALTLEVSDDMTLWHPWNDASNRPQFSAQAGASELTLPMGTDVRQFVRFRATER